MPAEQIKRNMARSIGDLLATGQIVAGFPDPKTSLPSPAELPTNRHQHIPPTHSTRTGLPGYVPANVTTEFADNQPLPEDVPPVMTAAESAQTFTNLDEQTKSTLQIAVTRSPTSPIADTDTGMSSSPSQSASASALQTPTNNYNLLALQSDLQNSPDQTNDSGIQPVESTFSVSLSAEQATCFPTKAVAQAPRPPRSSKTLRRTPSILSPIKEEHLEAPAMMEQPVQHSCNETLMDSFYVAPSRTSTPSDASTIVPEDCSTTPSPLSHPARPKSLRQPHRQVPETSRISRTWSDRQTSRAAPQQSLHPPQTPPNQNPPTLYPRLAATAPSLRSQSAPEARGSTIDPGQLVSSLLSEPVLFSYNRENPITRCWLPTCSQPTASNDGSTVICPRCTEYAYIRYCCPEHLHRDFYRHYTTGECTRRHNPLLIDEFTIMPLCRPLHTFIKVNDPQFDSLERVRQALYRSQPPFGMEKADYFIFTDVDNLYTSEAPDADVRSTEVLRRYRGTGGLLMAINIGSKKKEFRNLLVQCLELGYAAGTVSLVACGLIFVWLKDELKAMGVWDEVTVTRVCFAMQLEFGYKAPAHLCAT